MTLNVVGRYSSGFGSYEPGQVLSLSDEDEAFLLRDSPGSFTPAGAARSEFDDAEDARHADEAAGHAAPGTEAEADDADEEGDFDPTGAMSTETASGLVVPDRRARGGRRRRAE